MCEYEVNISTNEKTEKQNFNTNCCRTMLNIKVNDATCLWKGLDLSYNVCEYEVNWFTSEQVVRGKRNFNANCYEHRSYQSINRNFLRKIRLIKTNPNEVVLLCRLRSSLNENVYNWVVFVYASWLSKKMRLSVLKNCISHTVLKNNKPVQYVSINRNCRQ